MKAKCGSVGYAPPYLRGMIFSSPLPWHGPQKGETKNTHTFAISGASKGGRQTMSSKPVVLGSS